MRQEMFTEKNGDRPGVPNVGIVMTDGVANRDAHLTIIEATKAKNAGDSFDHPLIYLLKVPHCSLNFIIDRDKGISPNDSGNV